MRTLFNIFLLSGAVLLATPAYAEEAKEQTDPWQAFASGEYEKALEGFAREQVRSPSDPNIAFNMGSTLYKLKDYEKAAQAFTMAALHGDKELRSQAFYNLGNTAYQQGRLPESVELYKKTLEMNPDDQDAKYNIEYVQKEMKEREENPPEPQEKQDQENQNQENQNQENQNQQ
ncbi:tetratricopeptide repeat protein, partial [Myxococcota bacterium]|nr:tetratricopeptide repeat protein [Myxococcota bacterium]